MRLCCCVNWSRRRRRSRPRPGAPRRSRRSRDCCAWPAPARSRCWSPFSPGNCDSARSAWGTRPWANCSGWSPPGSRLLCPWARAAPESKVPALRSCPVAGDAPGGDTADGPLAEAAPRGAITDGGPPTVADRVAPEQVPAGASGGRGRPRRGQGRRRAARRGCSRRRHNRRRAAHRGRDRRRVRGRRPSRRGGAQAERRWSPAGLFGRASQTEREFLVRLLAGELHQGALEGVMAEAVARVACVPAAEVRPRSPAGRVAAAGRPGGAGRGPGPGGSPGAGHGASARPRAALAALRAFGLKVGLLAAAAIRNGTKSKRHTKGHSTYCCGRYRPIPPAKCEI